MRLSPMRRVLSSVIASRMRKPLHRMRSVASAICGPGLRAVFPVRIRCVDDLVEFLAREVVCRRLIHSDAAQAIRRVLSNPSSTNTEPEEAGETFAFFYIIETKHVKYGGGGGSRTFWRHLESVTY